MPIFSSVQLPEDLPVAGLRGKTTSFHIWRRQMWKEVVFPVRAAWYYQQAIEGI